MAVSPSRLAARLHRALALAPDDFKRSVAVPVDEFVHRLQGEVDRQREVLDDPLELGRADALGERPPRLAVPAGGLVVADPAFDRLRHALGWKAQLQPLSEGHLGAFIYPADVGDVGGDRMLADFDRCAVEADVDDVVLGAAVRAAAHLDVDLAAELVGDAHLFDPLLHRLVEPHRARDSELARIGAGAGHDVAYLPRPSLAETELRQREPEVVDALLAHPPQHEVLLHSAARVAAGVGAHELRQTAEL